METKVFESELQNKVKYEIHEAPGFSGRSELAIMIGGEVISVILIERRLKSGNIQCRPLQNSLKLLPFGDGKPEEIKESSPNLDDVTEGLGGSEETNENSNSA